MIGYNTSLFELLVEEYNRVVKTRNWEPDSCVSDRTIFRKNAIHHFEAHVSMVKIDRYETYLLLWYSLKFYLPKISSNYNIDHNDGVNIFEMKPTTHGPKEGRVCKGSIFHTKWKIGHNTYDWKYSKYQLLWIYPFPCFLRWITSLWSAASNKKIMVEGHILYCRLIKSVHLS